VVQPMQSISCSSASGKELATQRGHRRSSDAN
jgi:hypothetical protein